MKQYHYQSISAIAEKHKHPMGRSAVTPAKAAGQWKMEKTLLAAKAVGRNER